MGISDEFGARAAHLIGDLQWAFRGNDPPSRGELIESRERELDQKDAEESADRFAGRRCEELDRTWVKRNWAAFCYLSPTAWAYYIQALVRDALRLLTVT